VCSEETHFVYDLDRTSELHSTVVVAITHREASGNRFTLSFSKKIWLVKKIFLSEIFFPQHGIWE